MHKDLICVLCPNSCRLAVEFNEKEIINVAGALCDKGLAYASQELLNPQRNFASLIRVQGGHAPLVSVRLSAPVAKTRIFNLMDVIRQATVPAPIEVGQVLIADILGTGVDVIATKNIKRRD